MKAFVSYSFKDSELFIVTLLLEQLRKSGYVVETSLVTNNIYNIVGNIAACDIFLGIITNDSTSVDHVINEWKIARNNNVKHILVIENGVRIEDPGLSYVRFDRANPTPAINQLFNLSQPTVQRQTTGIEDVFVTGGIIIGIAALISLLSGGKK